MEGVSYGSTGSGALVDLAGLNFAIRLVLLQMNINLTIVAPTELKKFAVANGGASKEQMVDAWLRIDTKMAEEHKLPAGKLPPEALKRSVLSYVGARRPEVLIGPGVGIECRCQKGMHIFEDHFYPEIINPETGEVLPDGEFGELVLTTLTKVAMPMIRYRTRDLTRIIAEPCECGRTLRRIERISSRSDDMFIIRGVNVFPSQIETALLSIEGTMPHYNIILYTENGLDNIEVDVEINEELFSDKVRSMEDLQHRLTAAVEGLIGIRVRVKLVAPNTIQRSEGKARRVIDHRER